MQSYLNHLYYYVYYFGFNCFVKKNQNSSNTNTHIPISMRTAPRVRIPSNISSNNEHSRPNVLRCESDAANDLVDDRPKLCDLDRVSYAIDGVLCAPGDASMPFVSRSGGAGVVGREFDAEPENEPENVSNSLIGVVNDVSSRESCERFGVPMLGDAFETARFTAIAFSSNNSARNRNSLSTYIVFENIILI